MGGTLPYTLWGNCVVVILVRPSDGDPDARRCGGLLFQECPHLISTKPKGKTKLIRSSATNSHLQRPTRVKIYQFLLSSTTQ